MKKYISGWSWGYVASLARIAGRNHGDPSLRSIFIGFRLVRSR